MQSTLTSISDYKYGFHKPENYVFKSKKGLSRKIVEEISWFKNEPQWMRKFRLAALDIFYHQAMPTWGGDLSKINFDDIYYYIRPIEKKATSWRQLPAEIRDTYDRIGIPKAEKKFLGGVSAQYESEVVYKSIQKTLAKKGVVFLDMDSGLKEYPQLVREYFGTLVTSSDNKFAALNSAVWSGGSFIYVPKGIKMELPLQAYFRINAEKMGQFERTLIIADEGSFVHYVEGCTAPIYTSDSLHAAVVEIFVKKGARVRYTTIQNWSKNVYNLVTKRMHVGEEGIGEWVDGNIGCLTGEAIIFGNDYFVPIKEIKPGDKLYSLNADLTLKISKVIAKKENHPQPVFRLVTEDYREIEATENHPFLIMRKVGKVYTLSWTPLKEIKIDDLVGVCGTLPWQGEAYKINFKVLRGLKPFKFPEMSTNELLWFLGFYIGDGYMDRNRVYLAVLKNDKSFMKIVSLCQKLFGLISKERGRTLRFNSVAFVDFLKALGFVGRAQEKKVPDWIFHLPKPQITSFINGYIDADGYRRKGHKNISITSVNLNLLKQIKTLAYLTDFSPRKISKWRRKEKKPLGKEKKIYTHYFLYFGNNKKNTPLQFVRIIEKKFLSEKITYDLEVEDGNFLANGIFVHNSKLTMKYPSVYLAGRKARGEILSVAYGGSGQHQDAGGKAIHFAPETTSLITSKSVSIGGGRTTYRGLVQILPQASDSRTKTVCNALIIGKNSRSDTYPAIDIRVADVKAEHEATVSKISEEQLFYLASRGIKRSEAEALVVNGFIEPIVRQLPLEYAVELNRLIQLEMEGSVG